MITNIFVTLSKMNNISVRSVIVDQNPGVPRLSQVMDTSFIHSSRDTESGRVRDCLEVQFDASRELPPPPPAYDSRNFTLSPETTDCDSADLESELSVPSAGEGSYHSSGPKLHTSMPILEVSLQEGVLQFGQGPSKILINIKFTTLTTKNNLHPSKFK